MLAVAAVVATVGNLMRPLPWLLPVGIVCLVAAMVAFGRAILLTRRTTYATAPGPKAERFVPTPWVLDTAASRDRARAFVTSSDGESADTSDGSSGISATAARKDSDVSVQPVSVTASEAAALSTECGNVTAPQAPAAPLQPETLPSSAVPPSLDADVVLAALLDAASLAVRGVSAHLWLEDEGSGTLRLIESTGPLRPSSRPLPLDDASVLTEACTEGTARLGHVADIRHSGRAVSLWRYALPVTAGETRGVAAVDIETAGPAPDITAMPTLTAPLRASLAGVLALHVARTELETARSLAESVHDLSRLLDPEQVLDEVLARALDISGGETCSVMLLDSKTERLRIVRSSGLPDDVVRETSVAEGEGIAGWVLASGKPVLIEDVVARGGAGQRHGVRSAVSVLIADGEDVLGVLNVGSRSYPARFTASHLSALELLGRQCATALRNAQAVANERELYFDTLKALALALETKDPFSPGGTERILDLAQAIGDRLGIDDAERESLRIAALVHDLGMVSAGEGVLTSARPLTTVERALLRLHPKIAAEMLDATPTLRHVVPIVYHHHEWYDGTGYVSGLSGERIPLGSRILAVADAFVSITSDRPYRRARGTRCALEEIRDKAGTQFDPRVVEALEAVCGEDVDRVPLDSPRDH